MYYHVKNCKHKSKIKSSDVINNVSNADLLNLVNNINNNSREMTKIARILVQKVVDNDNKPKKVQKNKK